MFPLIVKSLCAQPHNIYFVQHFTKTRGEETFVRIAESADNSTTD